MVHHDKRKLQLLFLIVGVLLTGLPSVVTATSLRSANRQTQEYDCSQGCTLTIKKVCGTDGLTYQNECIAICQNKEIDHKGPCKGSLDAISSALSGVDPVSEDSTLSVDGIVTIEQIMLFAGEGYTFVVKRKFIKANPYSEKPENGEAASMRDHEENLDTETRELRVRRGRGRAKRAESRELREKRVRAKREKKSKKNKGKLQTIRITDDGCEYQGSFDKQKIPKGSETPTRSRNLKVIDTDARSVVANTLVYPYKLVGEIDLNGLQGGCTGTVVGQNAIVTAAHCFGSRATGLNTLGGFSPGRYRESNGVVVNPLGTFPLYYLEILAQYRTCDPNCEDYDVAILGTLSVGGTSVLSAVGGVIPSLEETDVTSSGLQDVDIRGYPEDKEDGSMWETGWCRWTTNNGKGNGPHGVNGFNYLMKHFCDTEGGMSGSALMTPDGKIRAIHTGAGNSNQAWNYAVRMQGDIIQLVTKYNNL